jgi:serine/threonine protein kinase
MTMQVRRLSNGLVITLDTELGSGGEGRIYTVLEEPTLVAKLYHHNKLTFAHVNKLKLMFENPPDDPVSQRRVSIAWPVDLLYNNTTEQIVGFLMHHVTQAHPIYEFYNPGTRRQKSPYFNYLYLYRTARNLATAISKLHACGYVIGDMNESNILVSEMALVTLVDTDSFQVRDLQSGVIYRCPVGKPEFTPPELQRKNFRDIDRTPEQDLFGLAVLLFELLIEGTHPFEGVFQGSGEPPPIATRILSGDFTYGSKDVLYRPKPLAPAFDILHPTLRQLFVYCFEDGHNNPKARPDARTWAIALEEAEKRFVSCLVNDQHRYGGHLNACPWCQRAAQLGGRDPFPQKPIVEKTRQNNFTGTLSPGTSSSVSTVPTQQSFQTVVTSNPVSLAPNKTSLWPVCIGLGVIVSFAIAAIAVMNQSIDYTQLGDLLANQKWQEADIETQRVMQKIAKGPLYASSLKKFPCQGLRTIDQLWITHSYGRFGFSVQRQMREKSGRLNFAHAWPTTIENFYYPDLANAPQGYLPARLMLVGNLGGSSIGHWWRSGSEYLLDRVTACGL